MNVNESRIDDYLDQLDADEANFHRWLVRTISGDRRADVSDAYHGKRGCYLSSDERAALAAFWMGES